MQIFIKAETDDDLERVVRYNLGKAHQIRKELKLLKEMPMKVESQLTTDEEITTISESETEEKENNEEYLYYYTNLMEDLKEAKTEEEKRIIIEDNLPTVNNKNYTNIVNRIKLELLKEIYELEELKKLETERDYIQEIETEKAEIELLLKLIQEIQSTKVESEMSTSRPLKNTLIFLQSHTGSTYAENDLYSISEEYYDSFKELILSIENGTFKNVKRFARNNNILKGICEVKDFKTRVIFDRIDISTYVIIDIFVKKSDCDNGYLTSLNSRVDYYKKNKSTVIEQIKDVKYLSFQQSIRDNLINGLSERNIIKTMKRG